MSRLWNTLGHMARPPEHVDGRAERKQVELLRAATPARRLARARSLSGSVIGLSRQAIRRRSPGLSEREVLLRFAECHYGAALASRVREYLRRPG
jgi:hypothetical protein